jgi:hypothetical protein
MKYLKGKSFYLCGGIHSADDDGTVWRDDITKILVDNYGSIVYDPCKMTIGTLGEIGEDKQIFQKLLIEKKFEELNILFHNIVKKDVDGVLKSDFLLVYYDPSIPLVGTIEEIVLSYQRGKNLILLTLEKFLPKANPWFFRFFDTDKIFLSSQELKTYLDKINKEGF